MKTVNFSIAGIVLIAVVISGCATPQQNEKSPAPERQSQISGTLLIEGTSDAIGANGVLLEAVGTEVAGGTFLTVLPKGCKLPCTVKQNFSPSDPKQTRIGFHLFRGNSSKVAGAHALGTVHISRYSRNPNGQTIVVVKFVADSSGIILSAKNAALDLVAP